MAHLGESHLAPLRKSFIFSRLQSLQSAPVYRAICRFSSDPAPLWRAAAVVRNRGDVLNRADLETGGLQRADRRLPARARALDEDIDLAHAVLHGAARGGLGRHLRGVGRRLAGTLETDLAGGGPGNHVAAGVGDRDDRVVERAPDVSVPVSDVLPLLAAHLLGRSLAILRRHLLGLLPVLEVIGPGATGQLGALLLADLLLAGHGPLLALAGAGVGLGALTVHGQPAAVPDALVAADLDLAADVRLHLAAQVTFDPVRGLDPVTQPDQVVVAQLMHPAVGADTGGLQRLQCPGVADAVDVGERDLHTLVIGEVNADEASHLLPRTPSCVRQAVFAACRWSALALLVPGVRADNHDPAMPADDPALVADLLDARLDLHGLSLLRQRPPGPCPSACHLYR